MASAFRRCRARSGWLTEAADHPRSDRVLAIYGGVAQLVERLTGSQEVRGFESLRLHPKVQVSGCKPQRAFRGTLRYEQHYERYRPCTALVQAPHRVGARSSKSLPLGRPPRQPRRAPGSSRVLCRTARTRPHPAATMHEIDPRSEEPGSRLGALSTYGSIWICGSVSCLGSGAPGVHAAGLTATVGASSMTLGGLLKHQGRSEDYWFSHQLLGRDIGVPWDSLDWASDWKWDSTGDTPQDLWALWEQNVERSRAALEEVLRSDGLGGVVGAAANVEPASVRWVLCHMIEEYARHNGHADLLRESVDGQTGE